MPILLQGLQRLEYRGYDSAGLVIVNDKKLQRARSTGRWADLTVRVRNKRASGIAHTRWQPMACRASATHTRI